MDNQTAKANGKEYILDVKPFLMDGRTMVPLRFIIEALGAQLEWSEIEQKITVKLNGNNITLWVGKTEAIINNETVFMDVPAMVENNRTLIPIRFVSEKLKLKVDFNGETNQITVYQSETVKKQITESNVLKNIVKSDKKYSGESKTGNLAVKYTIWFNSYNVQTGEFKGNVEWNGYNTIDEISGRIVGDTLTFKQISRRQNNKTTGINTEVIMKQLNQNRISGTWTDLLAGSSGTTWFEFSPEMTSTGKLSSDYDTKGYPTGKATLNFGDNSKFDGEVKVISNNLIAIGTITYDNGTKVIGRFINGKPDGMSSIIYPNNKAYLVDFKYGKPVDFYIASTIPVFKSNEIEVYKAHDIEVFKADNIEIFKADDIEIFHADDVKENNAENIEPYKADLIEMYKAEQVELNTEIVTIDKYEAEVATLNSPGSTDDIPLGGYSSPDYTNPLVQIWTSHMMALPYLINNNMTYRY